MKRLLSILLVCVMLLSLMPMTIASEEIEGPEETVAEEALAEEAAPSPQAEEEDPALTAEEEPEPAEASEQEEPAGTEEPETAEAADADLAPAEDPEVPEEEPAGDTDEPAADGDGPEDIWAAILELELAASAYLPEDYEALLPQVEALVLSSPSYEEGTLEYENGILFWWADGCLNGYNAETRASLNGYTVGTPTQAMLSMGDLAMEEIDALLESLPALDGGTGTGYNAAVFQPYYGYVGGGYIQYREWYNEVGQKLAAYMGGTCTVYQADDATIDNLANALIDCRVVLVNTHGSSDSTLCLTTGDGITEADQNDKHAWNTGYSTQTDDLREVWEVDGTCVANHMNKNANDCFLWLSVCNSMKHDSLCEPLRNKGVTAMLGFSESVSQHGDDIMMTFFMRELMQGETVAEAFVGMKKAIGCDWDPLFGSYTLTQAQISKVAFPIVVSDQDTYPGEGHVNIIQTVNCTWRLPRSAKAAEAGITTYLELTRGSNAGVTAIDGVGDQAYTSITWKSGSLPQGMTWSVNALAKKTLTIRGRPEETGVFSIVFDVTTESGTKTTHTAEVIVKNDGHKGGSQLVTVNAGTGIDIKLTATVSDDIYSIKVVDGYLPYTLECTGAGSKTAKICSRKKSNGNDFYTSPGSYKATLEIITTAGSVVRHTVELDVTPDNIYTQSYSFDAVLNQQTSIEEWFLTTSDDTYIYANTSIRNIELISGSLPQGLYLACGYHKGFGIYGSPTEAGDFTAVYRALDWSDCYNITIDIHVSEAFTVHFDMQGHGKQVPDQIIEYGGKVLRPSDPSEDGYIFQGWRTGSGNTYSFSDPVTKESFTLYAKWKRGLSGTVAYIIPIFRVGTKVSVGILGYVQKLHQENPEQVHFQWQRSEDGETGWQDISGATGMSYTPTASDIGKYIRVKVTADDQEGSLRTDGRLVKKPVCTTAVTTAQLAYTGSQARVTNPEAAQEYILLGARKEISGLTESDWAGAKTCGASASYLDMGGTNGTTCYVYTRVKETETEAAGDDVRMTSLYLGEVVSLQNIEIDCKAYGGISPRTMRQIWNTPESENGGYYTRVGEVLRLTAMPIPENAAPYNGVLGTNWIGDYDGAGTFYEDLGCTKELDDGTYYKTVYFKPAKRADYLTVAAQYTKGYNDLIYRAIHLIVGSGSGGNTYYDLVSYSARVTVTGGKTEEGFTPDGVSPKKATLVELTAELNSGEGTPPEIIFREDGSFDVNAENADYGWYWFNVFQGGKKAIGGIRVDVVTMPVETIYIPEYLAGEPGESYTLTPTLYPVGSSGDIDWWSTNSAVATVSKGVVTFSKNATAGDSTTITAKINGQTAVCQAVVGGQRYDLSICGVTVTDSNREDLGEILAERNDDALERYMNGELSMSFDGHKTLTIRGSFEYNGTIITNNGIDGLVIVIDGDCSLTSGQNALKLYANTTIKGEGTLTLTSGNDCAVYVLNDAALTVRGITLDAGGAWGISGPYTENGARLIVNNSFVHASGSSGAVCDLGGGIVLQDASIAAPAGAKIAGAAIVNADGTAAAEVSIEPSLDILGDVDRDGVLTTADAAMILSKPAACDKKLGDVNLDGKVNSADAAYILQFLAELIIAYPVG